MACDVVTFEDILAGALGADESRRLTKWLHGGAAVEKPQSNLVSQDEQGIDMRVFDINWFKRKRKRAGDPAKPAGEN